MRELKHHEQKLLKKVNFYRWKKENPRETGVIRRFCLQDREDYKRYLKVCGLIEKVTAQLRKLKGDDEDRIKMTKILLERLHFLGVVHSKRSLEQTENISVSSFCRRRLPVVLHRLKFCESIDQAVMLVQQGRK
eukprot:GHVU01169386.1.p3 GENE.GHVU01169386.1~~GHVU01169386.1.p3  ORF type:complete len:134 (+),score=19.69 GHVU01169386.1:396-797(+)